MRCPDCRQEYDLSLPVSDATPVSVSDDAAPDSTVETDEISADGHSVDWSTVSSTSRRATVGKGRKKKPSAIRPMLVVSLLLSASIAGAGIYHFRASKSEFTADIAKADRLADTGDAVAALKAYATIVGRANAAKVNRGAVASLDAMTARWASLAETQVAFALSSSDGKLTGAASAYAKLAELTATNSPALLPESTFTTARAAMEKQCATFRDTIRLATEQSTRGALTDACGKYREVYRVAKAGKIPAPVASDVKSAIDAWAGVYTRGVVEVEGLLTAGDKVAAARLVGELAGDVKGKEVPQLAGDAARKLLALNGRLNGNAAQVGTD